MTPTVTALERQVRQLRAAVLAMALTGAVIVTTALLPQQSAVLRVRGLVIVDDADHERIILGAPTPATDARARKDARTASLVFLGPDGADRLIVGDLPDPRIDGRTYQRAGGAYGLVIHDRRGSERGGIAELDGGRRVVTLSRPGQDAIEMVVDDATGFAGVTGNDAHLAGRHAEGARLGAPTDSASLELRGAAGAVRRHAPATRE